MHDDAFHLTPHDVRAQEFHRTMRGFDPAQVESFKQRVADELDRMSREKVQVDERVRGMVEQLRAFRDRERAMNDALVAAQQLREDIQAQANREAQVILSEARTKAAAVRDAHAREESGLVHNTEAARRQFIAYATSFRALLERQLAELNALEAAGRDADEGSPGGEAPPL